LENSTISDSAIPKNSLDFAMSLGVLHHISNTERALEDINSKLKSKGLFLGYLYYKVEDKPFLYRVIFSIANYFRTGISNLPFKIKKRISNLIAFFIYLPFAKLSKVLSKFKINTSNIPLHQYANLNFYMMKNDALDRFGTRLEKGSIKKRLKNYCPMLDSIRILLLSQNQNHFGLLSQENFSFTAQY
jgi:hypothetical protein